MENNLLLESEEKELELLRVNLSRGRGEITVPSQRPEKLPETLEQNLSKITVKELKKLCDSWGISRRGKSKVGDLILCIQEYFTEGSSEDIEGECISPKNILQEKSETYQDIFSFLKTKNYSELDFKTWINKGFVEKGWKQEAVAMLIIYSGLYSRFDGYAPHDPDSFNLGFLKKIKSLETYFESKIRKGGSYADLLLINEEEKKMLVFTSKNRNCGIGDFDISKIKDVHSKFYKTYELEIGIICPSEKKFISKKKKANKSSKILKDMNFKIIDQGSLYRKWKVLLRNFPNMKSLDKKILGVSNEFRLRFGQRIICDQVDKALKSGEKIVINGSECRFGKSYCMGQDVLSSKCKNILFLTSQPKTIPSIEEIFRKYDKFSEYEVVNLNSKKGVKSLVEKSEKRIMLVSIQTIRGYIKKSLDIGFVDLVIIDEFHESGDTEITTQVFQKFKLSKAIKIFYTATYEKVRTFYRVPKKNIFVWNQEDNSLATSLDHEAVEILSQKHHIDVEKILEYYDVEEVKKYYAQMVSLYFLVTKTTKLCQEDFRKVNSFEKTKNHGYSWKSVSMLTKEGNLKSPDEMVNYFQLFFGTMIPTKTKKVRYYDSELPYLLGEYEKICRKIQQRIPEKKTPLIIPMYMGQGFVAGGTIDKGASNIDVLSQKVRKLLIENEKLFAENPTNYDIVIYNSKTNEITHGNETLEDGFDRLIYQAKNSGKKGVILLLGQSLHTGITNKYCDLIKLNCDIKSFDRFYQTISRARNEVGHTKKHAFIMLDKFQGLGCLLDMVKYYQKKGESSKETFSRILRQKLINIAEIDLDSSDQDVIFQNYSSDDQCRELYRSLKSMRNITDDAENLIKNINFNLNTIPYSSVWKCIFGGKNVAKSLKLLETLQSLVEVPVDGIKEGVEIAKEEKEESKEIENEESKEIQEAKEIQENLVKEAIKHLTLLISLFSVSWNGKKWDDLLHWIKNTEVLDKKTIYDLIKEQLKISFPKLSGKTEETENVEILLETLELIISRDFLKEEIELIISEIKDGFQSRLGSMKSLYKEIERVIKPTEEARSKNAEILTPLSLAQEMIDQIPSEFWNVPQKVFEPTCGKGVFLCLAYEKFLEAGIPKKTILEECLYFADLNPVNVYICKLLLDPLNEYSLNYHLGDTLKLDIEKKWQKMNLVIGNPPYSTDPSKQNTKPLYDKFILKFIDSCNYLSFIVPSRWFAGGKGLDKFRKSMLLRRDIKLIKTFDNASEVFSGVSIEGGVNYFLKDSNWEGRCDLNGKQVSLGKYDIIPKNIFIPLIERTKNFPKISSIYMNRGYYKIETNDKRLKKTHSKKMLTCLVSLQKSSDRKKYITLDVSKEKKTWKVITAEANGKQPNFGYMNISPPNEIYTNSYIGFKVNSKEEAKNLMSYLKTKFANFMLASRKISQHINSSVVKWIPLVPLNKKWDDESVQKYFRLSDDEIQIINSI